MNPRGVCMITTHYPPWVGGAEKQVELISSWLARNGMPVLVITRGGRGLPQSEVRDGVRIVRVPVMPGKVAGTVSFLVRGLAVLLRERKRFGAIHSHQIFSPSTLGWLGSRLLGYPLVVNLHLGGADGDLERLLRRPRSGRLRLERLKRDASAFVAISDEIAGELRAEGIEQERIHLLVNAVDTDRFHPVDSEERARIRERLGLPASVPLVVYAGRLVERKGIDVLIEAWADVPEPARLVVLGDGAERDALEVAAERTCPGRVLFVGERQDVDDYLKAVDAWTLPSRGEGLPVSLLEAMSSALPVVSTPVGGIPEVVESGRNGWLVPVDDPAALAAALRQAIDGSETTVEMARKAREVVLERFGADRVASSYLELFRKLRGRDQELPRAARSPAARRM